MAWNFHGSSSNGSLNRMGPNSHPRLWVLKRRAMVLILFAVVLSGLLFSSLTYVLRQDSSGVGLRGDESLILRLHTKSKHAPVSDTAAAGGSRAAGTAASSKQQQVQSNLITASRRQRWRWKQSASQEDKQQHQQQQEGSPSDQQEGLASSLAAGKGSSSKGVALPSNLVETLQQQPPADVTPATPLYSTSQPGVLKTAEAAATAAKLVAAPEDLRLILASRQGEEQSGQQQTGETAAAATLATSGEDPADATSPYIKARGLPPTRVQHPLWWHGPMWSGSGYGSEAVNYVLSVLRTGRLAPANIWAYHHGDSWREHVVKSMSAADRGELEYLQSLPVKYRHKRSAVVVCHSVPTNWAFPEPMWVAGAPCPPNPKEFAWVFSVGRTMFETDRLPAVFVPRLNAMNEIWVPSEWQRQSFIQSGVEASKLVVVPEGVNTSLFDPILYTPLPLRDKAQLVFGQHWEQKLEQEAAAAAAAAAVESTSSVGAAGGATAAQPAVATGNDSLPMVESASGNTLVQQQQRDLRAQPAVDVSGTAAGAEGAATVTRAGQTSVGSDADGSHRGTLEVGSQHNGSNSSNSRQPFRFISTFKWEARKGWDLLLEAYLTAFTADDDVELYILTQPFGKSGSSFKDKMRGWADKLNVTQHSSSNSSSRFLLDSSSHHSPWLSERHVVAAAAGAGPNSGGSFVWGLDSSDHNSSSKEYLEEEDAGTVSSASRDQLWSDHVGNVVQQMQEFAGRLQLKRQLQAADTAPVSHNLAPAQQRQLLQASSMKAAGTTVAAQPQVKPAASSMSAAQQAAAIAAEAAARAEAAAARYPTLYVVNSHISDADFPRFYKTADAFVLPSRGEGWGRPHVEAMSMGLPVISTNWSGITAYLDDSVGYPIAVERLVPVTSGDEVVWWFRGLKWAQPSVQHLAQLMRRVYSNRAEAAAKGAAARARMLQRYSPEAIADVLVKELQRVQDKVP